MRPEPALPVVEVFIDQEVNNFRGHSHPSCCFILGPLANSLLYFPTGPTCTSPATFPFGPEVRSHLNSQRRFFSFCSQNDVSMETLFSCADETFYFGTLVPDKLQSISGRMEAPNWPYEWVYAHPNFTTCMTDSEWAHHVVIFLKDAASTLRSAFLCLLLPDNHHPPPVFSKSLECKKYLLKRVTLSN